MHSVLYIKGGLKLSVVLYYVSNICKHICVVVFHGDCLQYRSGRLLIILISHLLRLSCGCPVGRITHFAPLSVQYGLVTRKTELGTNVPQGTSKCNASFQRKRSLKFKVTRHQRPQKNWCRVYLWAGQSGAGGSGADCKLNSIVRPNLLLVPETLGS